MHHASPGSPEPRPSPAFRAPGASPCSGYTAPNSGGARPRPSLALEAVPNRAHAPSVTAGPCRASPRAASTSRPPPRGALLVCCSAELSKSAARRLGPRTSILKTLRRQHGLPDGLTHVLLGTPLLETPTDDWLGSTLSSGSRRAGRLHLLAPRPLRTTSGSSSQPAGTAARWVPCPGPVLSASARKASVAAGGHQRGGHPPHHRGGAVGDPPGRGRGRRAAALGRRCT